MDGIGEKILEVLAFLCVTLLFLLGVVGLTILVVLLSKMLIVLSIA